MNFYRLRETPALPYDAVFRESRLKKGLFFLICLAISATMAFIGYQGGIDRSGWDVPSTLAYYIAGVIAILALVALLGLRASLRETNWLIRYEGDRLLIKYRSYLNYHLPKDDRMVVEIGLSEIEWIRSFREKRRVPDSDGETEQSWTYLDICLNHSDTTELREYLRQERLRWPAKTAVSQSRRLHYPVRLIEDDLIRVDWKSHQTSITPNIDKTLRILGKKIEIRDENAEKKVCDFTSLEKLDTQRQEQLIRQLAESGDTLSATKVVQRLHGWSTTESVKYIRELLEK
ncbi:alkaline shock response membrane anchor protein AmaP [Acidobacteria bacterium AH-259-A15]|nr:alkaline shock response membrane anchor protein AmaP [Acidobacteria bacterium AH-259-A15]